MRSKDLTIMDNYEDHAHYQRSFFWTYQEFGNKFGVPTGTVKDFWASRDALRLAQNLIIEETTKPGEFLPSLEHFMASPTIENLVPVVDGAVDTIYVICQLFRGLGLNLDTFFAIVHAANMDKAMPDGTVLRRDDGKILKRPGWSGPEAQIYSFILKAYSHECELENKRNEEHCKHRADPTIDPNPVSDQDGSGESGAAMARRAGISNSDRLDLRSLRQDVRRLAVQESQSAVQETPETAQRTQDGEWGEGVGNPNKSVPRTNSEPGSSSPDSEQGILPGEDSPSGD